MMSLFDLYNSDGDVIPFEDRQFDEDDKKVMQSDKSIDYMRKPDAQSVIPKRTLQFSNLSKDAQKSNINVSKSDNVKDIKSETSVKQVNVDVSNIKLNTDSEVFDHDI